MLQKDFDYVMMVRVNTVAEWSLIVSILRVDLTPYLRAKTKYNHLSSTLAHVHRLF